MTAAHSAKQGGYFLLVGATAAAVHFAVLALAVEGAHVPPLSANLIAFAVAFCVSFAGHYRLTFRHSGAHWRDIAYAVAAVQNAVPDPFTATITLDDAPPVRRQMVMALMGNVGTITAGMTLFPRAPPTDGMVDLLLANPGKVVDWARLGAQILTGQEMEGFTLTRARTVLIEADRPVPFELDGDTAGSTRTLRAEVDQAALHVIVPW